jgi:hypothetical protein
MAAQDWNKNTLTYEVPAYDPSEGKQALVHMVSDSHARIKDGRWDGAAAMCGKQAPAEGSGQMWKESYGFATCPACLRAYIAAGGKGWFLPQGRKEEHYVRSIDDAIDLTKGAHYTNLAVRRDGQDMSAEADWVKDMRKL